MKSLRVPFALMGMVASLSAQEKLYSDSVETVGDASSDPAAIVGPVSDGTPPPVPPEREKPNFNIQETYVGKITREEPAQLADMRAVRHQVTATVHLVKDPKLPDLAPPLPALEATDPAVVHRMEELREKYQSTELVFVSATVYDHHRTLLRWYPNGGAGRQMTAWSNIDFNHLCGFATYSYNGRLFSLLMGIGNESTESRTRLASQRGLDYEPPLIPDLPLDRPAFVVTEGDTSDAAAMEVITGMHELYQAEGEKLRVAYQNRERARKINEARLRANPPQPQDVTLYFWKRGFQVGASTKEGIR